MKLKWALLVLLVIAALLVSGCCCCCMPHRGYYRVPYVVEKPGLFATRAVQGPTATVMPTPVK